MKPKIIEKTLNKKVNEWLSTINDPNVRKLAAENTIVTGGSIASLLLKEPVNDFDVYFRNKETVLAVAKYYADIHNSNGNTFVEVIDNSLITPAEVAEHEESDEDEEEMEYAAYKYAYAGQDRVSLFIKSAGISGESEIQPEQEEALELAGLDVPERVEREPYSPVFISENAITLNNKMQLIVRFFGEPDEIHNNYDFAHAMNYYDHNKPHRDKLVIKQKALECLLSKTLVYEGSLYPICSIIRARKFINRGWRISAGQYLKMAWQISKLDLNDKQVLREQLTGVDALYFDMFYYALTESEQYKNGDVDATYVAEVIDRIFND